MVNAAQIVLVSQMSAVAYYAILVWDWIISLSAEYKLIWKTDWSPYKILYLVNRYWTLLALAFSLWAYTATIDGATCTRVVNLVVCSHSSSLIALAFAGALTPCTCRFLSNSPRESREVSPEARYAVQTQPDHTFSHPLPSSDLSLYASSSSSSACGECASTCLGIATISKIEH